METLKVTFVKRKDDDNIYKPAYFNSRAQIVINPNDFLSSLQLSQQQILNGIGVWLSEGSGWTVSSINEHYINTVVYEPMRGNSYIPLPVKLQNSAKGLINLQNKDNECFRWCHIRYLNPQEKDPQRIKKIDRKMVQELNYQGVEFPVAAKHYGKIEEQNSININVFGYENEEFYPIHVSKQKNEKVLNLPLITQGEKQHYVLNKDFNKMIYNKTKHQHRKYFCMYCLQCFSTDEILTKHKNNCMVINGEQAIRMPKECSMVQFQNYHKQMPAPFVIYADFEAITEKVYGCQPDGVKSYTEEYQKHTGCNYGYKLVCCYDDKYSKPVKIYRGENSISYFMLDMLSEVEYCQKMISSEFHKPLQMADEEEKLFKVAEECHICGQKYLDTEVRVRDHCHITGQNRLSAHQDCNLKLRISPKEFKVPVIFHNLRGYDSHFIMQEIGSIGKSNNLSINCIPNNMEKYMAFMLGRHLVFLDSFQFMASSLERLAANLPADAFKYTSQVFQNEKLSLMKQKGVYPYDYVDSFGKFGDQQLPPKEEFYSILTGEGISDEQYQHAQKVWNTFNMRTMGEYHDLYLKSDILVLADVFENFRKTCHQYYKLDPCHYFTSPGLSWDAMLKMTGIKLELMTDVDMFQFIEKGLRGDISYIANRHGEANNKYMSGYNPEKPSKYIMYLDANNLYGWAMSQYLPTGGFRWMTEKQIQKVNMAACAEDRKKGMILEVDLEYPKELHELHNDYPLAAEKIKVTKEMLSPYCKNIQGQFGISIGQVAKLIPTLSSKKNYVLHYRNLQLYLSLGLKLKKVHRVLEFDQSPWLAQYINFNTQKRMNAKNAFEKDFFKLLNNSVFGKTMENIRKRVDVRLVTDQKKLSKLASKPTFVNSKIFSEDLVAVHKIKEILTLDRPAYVGMCILDLSETLMSVFHYNYVKSRYNNKAKLLFTDTDSLCYEIETKDIYKELREDKQLFDNSDYPKDSLYFSVENKKVIGKFKDEAAGMPIREFIGLRSKMYSYVKDSGKNEKTAKGVRKYVIKKNITHDNYKDCLLNGKQMLHSMRTIRSDRHQIGSYELNKISLSCFDDKRYILADGKTSYAYGHYKTLN